VEIIVSGAAKEMILLLGLVGDEGPDRTGGVLDVAAGGGDPPIIGDGIVGFVNGIETLAVEDVVTATPFEFVAEQIADNEISVLLTVDSGPIEEKEPGRKSMSAAAPADEASIVSVPKPSQIAYIRSLPASGPPNSTNPLIVVLPNPAVPVPHRA
jgi:hypothetical protein